MTHSPAAAAIEPVAPVLPIAPVGVAAYTVTTAAGVGRQALHAALAEGRSALSPHPLAPGIDTWVGRVDGLDTTPLPPAWAHWDARATRLAWLALKADGFADAVAAVRRDTGASRIGLVLGSSASTIAVSEQAYRALAPDGGFPADRRLPALNTPHAVAAFVQQALGLQGPAMTVSTACSSSAKAFAQAERWLRLGWADAVVVGGVEALCDSILHGFRALGLVAPERCRPFDRHRQGLSVGEAAGFALLLRDDAACRLRGHGESVDAHHMSAPHPEGRGAEQALDAALARAALGIEAIDYLNLHATGTAHNDAVEAALLGRRYGAHTHASATKGVTGHTMGAAGLVEAVVCLLALETGLRPGSVGCDEPEAAAGPALRRDPVRGPTRVAASHSFGFGGSNAVLLFDRASP